VFIQFGLEKHPELSGVSWIYDYARNDDDRAAMDLLLGPQEFGRPYIAPPDVPEPVVAILRRAFDDTMKDPTFRSEAEKRQLDIDPVGGAEIQKLIEKMYRAPPAVVEKVRAYVEKM
jgi:hypothetical protein